MRAPKPIFLVVTLMAVLAACVADFFSAPGSGAMLRVGQGIPGAVALHKRAASAKPSAEPYVSPAETELRRLTSGES